MRCSAGSERGEIHGVRRLHGGVLKASSGGSGLGSRFTLTLPRLPSADPIAGLGESVEPPNLAGKRVLVVDDDADSREIASKALAGTGAAVTQAGSGIEALDEWRRQRFDVLICDLAIALTALASDFDRQAVLLRALSRAM